jgi:hypothetical protein
MAIKQCRRLQNEDFMFFFKNIFDKVTPTLTDTDKVSGTIK